MVRRGGGRRKRPGEKTELLTSRRERSKSHPLGRTAYVKVYPTRGWRWGGSKKRLVGSPRRKNH